MKKTHEELLAEARKELAGKGGKANIAKHGVGRMKEISKKGNDAKKLKALQKSLK